MNNSILKIGHRGAKAYVAENTIESIQKALELGADGVEIDVHVCASGELVVFHDFTMDRMTNGTGEISKKTLSELKKLKVHGGFQIPVLEEVLDAIDKKCLLNIELKGRHSASKTCEVIQSYVKHKGWQYQHFIVSSFQYQELDDVFKVDKNIPLAVLTEADVFDALEFAETIKAVSIHPDFILLTKENVKQVHAKGYKVITWTVNDAKSINRMKSYGVDGIISDNPDRL